MSAHTDYCLKRTIQINNDLPRAGCISHTADLAFLTSPCLAQNCKNNAYACHSLSDLPHHVPRRPHSHYRTICVHFSILSSCLFSGYFKVNFHAISHGSHDVTNRWIFACSTNNSSVRKEKQHKCIQNGLHFSTELYSVEWHICFISWSCPIQILVLLPLILSYILPDLIQYVQSNAWPLTFIPFRNHQLIRYYTQ
jgi:hypothetical protein